MVKKKVRSKRKVIDEKSRKARRPGETRFPYASGQSFEERNCMPSKLLKIVQRKEK